MSETLVFPDLITGRAGAYPRSLVSGRPVESERLLK